MAGLLLIAGLTGALLAWYDQLDSVFAPTMYQLAPQQIGTIALDPLVLRERVLAAHPEVEINFLALHLEPGKPLRMNVQARPSSEADEVKELANDQWFIDPYSGAVVAKRQWGDISQGLKNLMPFVYRLHYSLALGVVGGYAFGIVALLWTLDCFIGAYLTFPPRKRRRAKSTKTKSGKNWWQRWLPAWRVRWHSSRYKINFDLHRAGGLWPWAMLLVLAWSSVAFNLSEVYQPVMRTLLAHQAESNDLPELSEPRQNPAINWARAHAIGRQLIAELAQQKGFEVNHEQLLYYQADKGIYTYRVHSSRDVNEEYGRTQVLFDANNGALVLSWLPSGVASGDTFTSWIETLHMAAIWGWPFRVFMSLLGIVVAILSVTGVVIWWRKRAARRWQKAGRSSNKKRAWFLSIGR
ncbi:MAG: PepSY domain-containing protein [Pseudomonadales bacterium]|nr:PepSY domain-containing protein [Pseudomonadales bacterium]